MRSPRTMFVAACTLPVVLGIAGCADDALPTGASAVTPSFAVTASPTSPATVSVGDTVTLNAAMKGSVTWTVRNESVARLISNPNATRPNLLAVGQGKTYVVAVGRKGNTGKQDSTLVTVGTGTAPVTPPDTQPTTPPDTQPSSTTQPEEPTTPPAPPTTGAGLWMSPTDIAALPTSGSAWSSLKSTADGSCGSVDLANQDQSNNVCIMAKALVFARTGTPSYRTEVVAAIRTIAQSGTYSGRALALGRELAAYVIAADLIGLKSYDASLDGQFRSKLAQLRTTSTTSGPGSLVECHEERPNNWGTMCGATRIAIAAYLGDRAELDRAAQVFRGWLGDRSAYAGFSYGDLSWQCDASRPVGINPKGCVRDGHSLDGVLPDDQRRGGSYTWPAPKESYVYEALQGAVTQAVLLSRQGYDVWNWSDRALLRAFTWVNQTASFTAEGDDKWQPHIINRVYGTSFAAPVPAGAGKIAGWTDWTHGR